MELIGPDLLRLSSGGFAAVHVALGDSPTLIDAGAPGRGPAIERELRARGIAPRRIVLTHADPDHVGAADHLRRAFDCEVLAGAEERPLIDRSGWADMPRRRRVLFHAFLRGTPAPTVDSWLSDGEELDGLRVVATPGHTPGHLSFQWRGWVVAGDALVSGNRCRESPWLFTMDRATARRSIEDLAARQPLGISSSHGRPVKRGAERLAALIDAWRPHGRVR